MKIRTLSLVALAGMGNLICWSSETEELISGNPAAVNDYPGTGELGGWIGVPEDWGLRLGGVGIVDFNWLISGGAEPGNTTWNYLFVAGANADLEKSLAIPGASIGAQILLFKGADTNGQAGTVQGYNGLVAAPPYERAELYQLFWRQSVFEDKLVFRLGKSIPSVDFGNVLKPIPVASPGQYVPSMSGLIFTPIFTNPTMLGVLPGYYDSAYGVTVSVSPIKEFSVSWGMYDGSLAQGFNTGDHVLPVFDGSYFMVAELSGSWHLASNSHLGRVGFGGWQQTGKLTTSTGLSEDGTYGFYGYASQTVWEQDSADALQGIILLGQMGINDSETLPINGYVGVGITAFGIVPSREGDSFGAGFAYSWLNTNVYLRDHEAMLQAYYQAKVMSNLFIQPSVSYINNPGANPRYSDAWTLSLRATVLF